MVTEKEVDKSIGALIRDRRKELNMTQEKLSYLTGITSVYCRDIEHGRSCPNWIIMGKICKVLRINLAELADIYIKPRISEKPIGLKI